MVLPNLWQANHDPSRWTTPDTLNPDHFLLPGKYSGQKLPSLKHGKNGRNKGLLSWMEKYIA